MRISDWSSDVCSSDLPATRGAPPDRAAAPVGDPPSHAPALPEKPSLAVMPFLNLSGEPAQDYFIDGVVEDIVSALSRIRWLFVIARNSSFTSKGRLVDVKPTGRASCRESVCTDVEIWVVAVLLK